MPTPHINNRPASRTPHRNRPHRPHLLHWLLIGIGLVDLASAHGGVIGLNGDTSGASGGRSYTTHKLLHGQLREWNPYSLNGVDGRVDQTDSACGEPGQTSHQTLKYAGVSLDAEGNTWDIGRSFSPGESIKFRVAITANHGGIMEMRYACTDGMDHAGTLSVLDFYDVEPMHATASLCYNANRHSNIWRDGRCHQPRTLKRDNVPQDSKTFHSSHPEWYHLPQPTAGECFDEIQPSPEGMAFDLEYRLPSSLTGCSRMVVQWWWQTSNGCIPPIWREWKAASTFPCPSTQWPQWGMPDCDAEAGTKARSGEQFVSCVDFELSGSTSTEESTQAPTVQAPTAQSTPASTPESTQAPTAASSSGEGVCYTKAATGGWCDKSAQNCMPACTTDGAFLGDYCAYKKGQPCQGARAVCEACANSVWVSSGTDPSSSASPSPAGDGPTAQPTNEGSWAPQKLKGTHFWDCSGMGCDATVLQPWNPDKYIAPPGYQPTDPADHGGAAYGERIWMVGAASDLLAEQLGDDDGCCGSDNDSGGCGKCILVQNPDAVNSDWKVLVMKKNRCPPWSNGCAATDQPHMDFAVPGFDNLQYSTANICGAPNTGFDSKAQSGTLGSWYNSCADTAACAAMCDQLPVAMQPGCRLFAEWGWKSGDPGNLDYAVVACPSAFKEHVGAQFDENGVVATPSQVDPTTGTPTETPPATDAPTPTPIEPSPSATQGLCTFESAHQMTESNCLSAGGTWFGNRRAATESALGLASHNESARNDNNYAWIPAFVVGAAVGALVIAFLVVPRQGSVYSELPVHESDASVSPRNWQPLGIQNC